MINHLRKIVPTCFLILLFFNGCQKELTDTLKNSAKVFDVAEAKEWYYGVFKKSSEWQQSPDKGKKTT